MSVDSLVSLHRLIGALCFGPLLLRSRVQRGDQIETFLTQGQLYDVGSGGHVSVGLQACSRRGGSSHILSGTDIARMGVLLTPQKVSDG